MDSSLSSDADLLLWARGVGEKYSLKNPQDDCESDGSGSAPHSKLTYTHRQKYTIVYDTHWTFLVLCYSDKYNVYRNELPYEPRAPQQPRCFDEEWSVD